MKISVLQENLLKALVQAKPFVGASGSLPICGTVRLTTNRGMLMLDTTDLDKAFNTRIGAMVEEDGGVCVNHKTLTDFVRTLPNDRLDLEVAQAVEPDGQAMVRISGDATLIVRATATEATFSGHGVGDFPAIVDKELDNPVTVVFDPGELAENALRVLPVAAKDDSRPVLTGVNLRFQEEGYGYELAAADGFRLAIQYGSPVEAPEEPFSFIIPTHTLAPMTKLMRATETPVRMHVDREQGLSRIEIGDCLVMCQLLNGTYPDYPRLVPDNIVWQLRMDAGDLKRMVDSAAVYAEQSGNIIRLVATPLDAVEVGASASADEDPATVGNCNVHVSARDDADYANRESLVAFVSGLEDVEGGDSHVGRIAFNVRYLRDLLKSGAGQVILGAQNPSSPGLWTFPDVPGYKQVVMPMYCQW